MAHFQETGSYAAMRSRVLDELLMDRQLQAAEKRLDALVDEVVKLNPETVARCKFPPTV